MDLMNFWIPWSVMVVAILLVFQVIPWVWNRAIANSLADSDTLKGAQKEIELKGPDGTVRYRPGGVRQDKTIEDWKWMYYTDRIELDEFEEKVEAILKGETHLRVNESTPSRPLPDKLGRVSF